MKSEIKIPAMGESISEATIGTILASNGSVVRADQEILEIETDKVNQLLYAPQTGRVDLTVKSGDTVKIGQVIGTIDTSVKAEAKPAEEKAAPQPEISAKPVSSPAPPKLPKSQPYAESIRFTKEDFLTELKQEPKAIQPVREAASIPKGQRETRQKMSKIRRVIAQRLVDVHQTTAMLTTFNEVDLSEIMQLREKYKESFAKQYGVKLGLMSFFVKAVVSALQAFPELNAYIDGEEIVYRHYYDIGIAVGTEKGVIVPVLRQCDQLSFAEIEQAIERFAKKARDGQLVIDDLQGAGFTITNGGVYGSLLSTPILNPPQSGILGMHKIEKRPIAVNDQVVIRQMMYLALSYDHRIVDGKEAVSFLVHVKQVLEDPSRLLLKI